MRLIPLNSLRPLKEADVPETQAKAFSIGVQESHKAAELVIEVDLREHEPIIRSDLEKVEAGLSHEIGDLRKDIDVKLSNLKFRPLKWLIELVITQASLVISLLKFFPSGS